MGRKQQGAYGNGSTVGKRMDMSGLQVVRRGHGRKTGWDGVAHGSGTSSHDGALVRAGGRRRATPMMGATRVHKSLIPSSLIRMAEEAATKPGANSKMTSMAGGFATKAPKINNYAARNGKQLAGAGAAGAAAGVTADRSVRKSDGRVYIAERNRTRRQGVAAASMGIGGGALATSGVHEIQRDSKTFGDQLKFRTHNKNAVHADGAKAMLARKPLAVSRRAGARIAGGAGLVAAGVGTMRYGHTKRNAAWQ